jgi:toxin secretion/phage lysis holin
MGKKLILAKSMMGIISASIMDKLIILFPTVILLMILMITDYISGMLASKKEALDYPDNKQYGWSSKKSLIGIYKKASYIFVILVAVCTDYIIYKISVEIGIQFDYKTLFSLLVTVWLIINELISILENAGRMGAKLPDFLKRVLQELRSNVDKKIK